MAETSSGLPEDHPHLVVQFCGSRCGRRSSLAELAAVQRQRGGETLAELREKYGAAEAAVIAGRRVTLQMLGACIGACSKDPAARVMLPGDVRSARYFRADSAEAVEAAVAAYETPAEPEPRG